MKLAILTRRRFLTHPMTKPYSCNQLSEHAWLIFYSDKIELQLALKLDALVASATNPLVEWVAGDDSLMLVTNVSVDTSWVENVVTSLITAGGEQAVKQHTIGVRFNGPDREAVARFHNLDVDSYISRFCADSYTVGFMGFAPGFGYLKGGSWTNVPRKDEPRSRMQQGAVAVAAGYACIYPVASPGGWNWIGETDSCLFDPSPEQDNPFLFTPFDQVTFIAL